MAPTPIPAALDLIPVTGLFVSLDGTPLNGTVTFATAVKRIVHTPTKTAVYGAPLVGKVVDGELRNAAGTGPLYVYATDDPDLSPTIGSYNVSVTLTGGITDALALQVPVSAAGTGVDLSTVARTAPIPPSAESYVLLPAFSALAARVTTLETTGGGGGGSAPQLTIGTVTTGAPGSSAAASIAANALSLTIPRGATGAQGPAGPVGPAGPAGSAGTVRIPDAGSQGYDDAPMIQTILDANPGKTIIFPAQTYHVGAPIRYRGGQYLLGEGAALAWNLGATIVLTDGANPAPGTSGTSGVLVPHEWWADVVSGPGIAPTVIDNLHVVGASWANSTRVAGIIAFGYWQHIKDCFITDCTGDGVLVTNVSRNNQPITLPGLGSEFRLSGSKIVDVGEACVRQRGLNNADGHLIDNFLSGCRHAVYMDSAVGWDISHNHTYDVREHALYLPNAYATQITNNYLEDFGVSNTPGATFYGIFVAPPTTGGRGAVIMGNSAACAEPAGTSPKRYITIDASSLAGDWNVALVGNSLRSEAYPSTGFGLTVNRTGMTGALEVASAGNALQAVNVNRYTVLGAGGTYRFRDDGAFLPEYATAHVGPTAPSNPAEGTLWVVTPS